MQNVIIGPSHITRWRWEMNNGSLPIPPDFEYWGRMGMPIFSNSLSKKIKQSHAKGKNIYLLVPDFRFGNSVINDSKNLTEGKIITNDSHIKLSKELITRENDIFLYNNAIDYLERYLSKFTGIKLIFWCLFSRERQNIKNRKYIDDNTEKYNHPIWNLEDLEKKFIKNTIPLHKIINNENIDSLFIDQQGHPTLKGFALIHNAIIKNSFEDSFRFTDDIYNSFINEIFISTR